MKSFPTAFTTAKNTKLGIKPFWILRVNIAGTFYYLASRVVSIPSFVGSTPWPASTAIDTLAWVGAWGNVQEGITGYLAEFHVSNFSATLIIDPDASPNIETLVTGNPVEENPVELYCWFEGCPDPPQLMFKGYISEASIPTPTTASITIQDDSVKLERNFIGRRLNLSDFPLASPSDVGTFLPIPYGSVTLQAVPIEPVVETTLVSDITSSAALIFVSSTWRIAVNDYLYIDSQEFVKVTSVHIGNVLGVLRGQGGSTAAAHSAGAALRNYSTSFVPIPAVYLVADCPVDSFGRVFKKNSNGIQECTARSTMYTGKPGNEHPSYPGVAILTISFGLYPALPVLPLTVEVVRSVTAPLDVVSDILDQAGMAAVTQVGTFPIGTPESLSSEMISNGSFATDTVWTKSTGWTISGGKAVATAVAVDFIILENISLVAGHLYEITYTISTITSGSFRANAAGSYGIERAFTGTYTERIIAGAAGYAGITGGSSSNSGTIDNVSVKEVTPATINYVFNGAIDEYQTALYWLNYLALQCCSWFVFSCTGSKLIYRPSLTASSKTISAIKANKDGRSTLSRQKTALSEEINTINLLYGRDYTQGRGAAAYQATSSATDATAITTYGAQEQSNLFMFDFVNSSAYADDARDFYLAEYKDRHWLCTFDVFLDNMELEFGDVVTLPFMSGSPVGIVIRAEHYPGAVDRMDTVKLTVLI